MNHKSTTYDKKKPETEINEYRTVLWRASEHYNTEVTNDLSMHTQKTAHDKSVQILYICTDVHTCTHTVCTVSTIRRKRGCVFACLTLAL